jgi:hypothetical protein
VSLTKLKVTESAVNQGNGVALQPRIYHDWRPYILIQYADLEYATEKHLMLIKPIHSGKAGVVFGSRFNRDLAHRVLYFPHSIGNQLLTLLSNMFTNLNFPDMNSCCKIFRREIKQSI